MVKKNGKKERVESFFTSPCYPSIVIAAPS